MNQTSAISTENQNGKTFLLDQHVLYRLCNQQEQLTICYYNLSHTVVNILDRLETDSQTVQNELALIRDRLEILSGEIKRNQ